MFEFAGTLKGIQADLEKEGERLAALETTKVMTMEPLRKEANIFFSSQDKRIQIILNGNNITFPSETNGSVAVSIINSTNFAVSRHCSEGDEQETKSFIPAKFLKTQELSRLIVRWIQKMK